MRIQFSNIALVAAFTAALCLAQQVYASTNAETPILSTQPVGSNVLNGASHVLNVSARVSDGGTLSYQWFTNAIASNEEGTAISGATSASFTPSFTTVGKFYYYVVVTNTNNSVDNKTATVASNVATVNVISITNAAIPVISTQPASGDVTIGTTRALTVSASVSDGGTLSYQWYSNSTASGTGGTAISGAINASYTPTATTEMGIFHYYVVVTNTNNSVPDNKTATIVSNVATVRVTPIFFEDFENSTKFTIVNGSQTNKFFVGSAVAKDGTRSAYISDDNGTTNAYNTSNSSVVHMYSNVTFPASTIPYILTFDWKVEGEGSFDNLKVFLVSTGTTPTQGVQLTEATPIGTFSKGGASTWNKAYISIPAYATQTTMRLVFSWQNDASAGTQPPAAIDNILLVFSKATTIISEDFEATNSYNIVNGTEPNKWHPGTAVAKSGTRSAYISNNNGTTNAYTTTSSSATHMYRNVTFPASSLLATFPISPYVLTFDWQAVGESVYDNLKVFLVPTTTTPVAGIKMTDGSQLAGGAQIGDTYSGSNTWQKASINIPAYTTQTTMRLVFSWQNDASSGTQPPAAIDNILLSKTELPAITIPASPTTSSLTVIKAPAAGGSVSVNGTNITGTSTYTNGTQVSLVATPAAGYVFTGWSGASTSTNNTISLTMNGNRTITANFQILPTTYSLTVNKTPADGGAVTVGGTTIIGSATYDVGAQIVATAIPANGYKFTGWSGTATSANADITLTMNSTQTLTANFETITYNIAYNLNGGTQNVQNPTTYLVTNNVALSNPTRVGYTFEGWFDNTEFNGTAITSIPLGSFGNRDLYAKWTPTNYTITYTLGGGTVSSANPTSYTIETAAFTLNNPTRTGYTFAGWTGTNGSTPQTNVSVHGSTGDKSYTANWTLITYTVTFDANGGTVTTATGTTGIGWKLTSLPTPAKTGYTFEGWFSAETGGVQVTTSTVFNENTTIYARWTPANVQYTQSTCTAEGLYWYDNTCNGISQAEANCSANGNYWDNGKCLTESQVCTASGQYWYNNTCNGISQAEAKCYADDKYWYSNKCNNNPPTEQQLCQADKGIWYKDNCYATQAEKNEAACYEREGYYWEDGKCKTDQTPVLPGTVTFSNLIVKAIPNGIRIENLPEGAKAEVFNLQGKRVYSAYPENSSILKILVQTKGVYVVKIGTQTIKVAVK